MVHLRGTRTTSRGTHEVGSGLAALDVDGHLADVRLNRPEKRNAMTVELMADLDDAARALADRLTGNAPLGMQNAKRALDAALETPLDEGLALERALGRELDSTRDYREGFEARIEGREPEFEGR